MPAADSALVLDTHVWLDVAMGRGRMSRRVLRRLTAAAEGGVLYVAAITPWEVAMLVRRGKLRVATPLTEWIPATLLATRTVVAPLEPTMAVDAVELPAWDHGDPADRMIVATARHARGVLVTRDVAILEYAEKTRAVRVLEPG